MNRPRTLAVFAVLLAGACGLVGAIACNSSTTPTLYTPITGLVIDSSALVEGVGCGTTPGQVFRYAAIVRLAAADGGPPLRDQPAGLPASGVFDCFTNGQFSNLPTPDGSTTDYDVSIYAFDERAFPEALGGCADVESDAACPGDNPATVAKYESQATWSTSCVATQVQGVSGVAVCRGLLPTSDASLGGDDASDGGDATGGEGGDGGSPEGSILEGGEAEAGPSPEGGDAGDAGAVADGSGDAGPTESGID